MTYSNNNITVIGVSCILMYSIYKLTLFMNISIDNFYPYLFFLIFLIICYLILPSNDTIL